MASILIVDDDEDIREILKYNLEKENHSVRAVSDGLKCLAEVSKEKPDLILLDVMMPGMDGIEVCEQLKAATESKDILICFLTARSEDYSQIAGLESGGDDYVTKPIKPKVLVSRINALLRRIDSRNPIESHTSNELRINREKYLIEKDGKEIQLPKKEFELLALLVSLLLRNKFDPTGIRTATLRGVKRCALFNRRYQLGYHPDDQFNKIK